MTEHRPRHIYLPASVVGIVRRVLFENGREVFEDGVELVAVQRLHLNAHVWVGVNLLAPFGLEFLYKLALGLEIEDGIDQLLEGVRGELTGVHRLAQRLHLVVALHLR